MPLNSLGKKSQVPVPNRRAMLLSARCVHDCHGGVIGLAVHSCSSVPGYSCLVSTEEIKWILLAASCTLVPQKSRQHQARNPPSPRAPNSPK